MVTIPSVGTMKLSELLINSHSNRPIGIKSNFPIFEIYFLWKAQTIVNNPQIIREIYEK